DSLLDTDPPEAGCPMDREAGAVLDQDPGLEGPDPGGLGSINQGGEERPADPPSLHIGGHVDAQPGHPGIDLPARARGEGGPGDDSLRVNRDQPAVGPMGVTPARPVRSRLAFDRGVAAEDAGFVDRADSRPVTRPHRLDGDVRGQASGHPGRATIGVARAPRRSTRRTTSSPGSRYRPRVASRISSRQPLPTVPLPIRSPGRRPASAEARASIWPNENRASAQLPRDSWTPFTSAVRASDGAVAPAARSPATSSGVTSQGPIELAKSLPLAGPSRTAVSSRWRSRALQSLRIK